MEKINRIIKGVNKDLDPRYQPEDTLRDSVNGIIVPVGDNSYAWRPLGKTEIVFTLTPNEKIYGHCRIKERLILLTWSGPAGITYFKEVLFDNDMNATVNTLSQESGNPLNLHPDFPIRVMLGFYEAEDIQRVYFTDYNNQPRVVNIGNSTFIFNAKFADFFPVLEHVYGVISLKAIISGGALPAGNYFFCWQYYTKDGYYTDWSYLSNPVTLTGDNPLSSALYEYQRMQGQPPDFNTRKSILMKLSNIDTDYDSIRVGAFYSNDLNSAQPGVVFFDSDISGAEMEIMYRGGENIGIVLIEDLVTHSTVIEKAKEMRFIKKRNVIAVTKERDELEIGNQLTAEITHEVYEIPLDVTGAIANSGSDKYALFAAPNVVSDRMTLGGTGILRAGVWYKVTGANLNWTDSASNPHTENLGTRFKPSLPGIYTPGPSYPIPIIRKKLYKLNSSVPADPTNLTATRATNAIILQWNDNSFIETGLRIEWRQKGSGTWQTDLTVPANIIYWSFTATDSTIILEFRIWAYNANGDSVNPTNTVEQRSLPPAPAAPSSLAASNNQIDKIVLTWTDNATNEQGFILQYRKVGGLSWKVSPMVISADTETVDFTSSSLIPGDSFGYYNYEFRLQSYNEGGNSTYSNTATGKALQQAPTTAPSSFNVYQLGNCLSMSLDWAPVSRAEWYRLERWNGSSWDLLLANHPNRWYSDIDAINQNNVYFSYRVRGENSGGVGPWAQNGETAICDGGVAPV